MINENNTYSALRASSFLDGNNLAYVEELYDQYLREPQALPAAWRAYFDKLPASNAPDVSLTPVRERFLQLAQIVAQPTQTNIAPAQLLKQEKVNELINAYRALGHRMAQTDPLHLKPAPIIPELQPDFYGLSPADLNQEFDAYGFPALGKTSLRNIIDVLKATYCGALASEFMYITDTSVRRWVQENVEKTRGKINLSAEQQKRILERLTAADGLERYIGTKFVGQKRFSIEGADALIPMLDNLFNQGSAQGVKETLIGMAHRGRLNVLVNVAGKPARELFDQFAGKHFRSGSGDVKYHEGYTNDVRTQNGIMHVALAFNPSHLEIVSPVVEGAAHAKQSRRGDQGEQQVLPVIIHGDAAFAGQGVVMETLNLAQVAGYKNGGSIHIILNNQVGFTTDQHEARSTLYCTDIAKMFEVPVFHVNGDDPEAALLAMNLAFEFRMKFKRDAIIEVVCYRRFGHNEADEPMATQPLMYRVVKELPTPRAQYAQRLIAAKVITPEEEKLLQDQYRDRLDAGQPVVDVVEHTKDHFDADWKPYVGQAVPAKTNSTFKLADLRNLAQQITILPAGFTLQPQVGKMLEDRKKMAAGELPLDWGCAETLAYATLLVEGHNIRISGQDSQRGTFAHRHAVLHDMQTGDVYMPLAHLPGSQANIEVLNSILSEFAVMAFEYGYAGSSPNDLVIWEAQFGDFANGAQVVIDQFLSSGEEKWARLNGLTLLLPHGYEGQGPEHSSARLERFLQLCAQDNMFVCTPTTPAQTFHMLRRQVLQSVRKPLIVMTPKSLLRHKLAVSSLEELSAGTFQTVIPEVDALKDPEVKRIVFCAGKVYYDLLQKRRELKRNDIAIVRIEQVYPFPSSEIAAQLKRYSNAKEIILCQEEPQNQGVWYHVQPYLMALLASGQTLKYAGRSAAASPATGYPDVHVAELKAFLQMALEK